MNFPIEIKKQEIINSSTTAYPITTILNPFVNKSLIDNYPKKDDKISSSYIPKTIDNNNSIYFNVLPLEKKDFSYLTSLDKNFNSLPSLDNKSGGFTFENLGVHNFEPQNKVAQINLNEATIRPDLVTTSFQFQNENSFQSELKVPAKSEHSSSSNLNILDFGQKDEKKVKDKYEPYTVPERKKEEKYEFFNNNEVFSTALNLKINSFNEYDKINQKKKEGFSS